MTVGRVSDERWLLVLTFHHLILDGWSLSLVLKTLNDAYTSRCAKRSPLLRARPPFRNYVDWLERRDKGSDESYWRGQLSGEWSGQLGEVVEREQGEEESGYGEVAIELSERESQGLVELGRRERVTLNTVMQGAWGLVLSRAVGSERVVRCFWLRTPLLRDCAGDAKPLDSPL